MRLAIALILICLTPLAAYGKDRLTVGVSILPQKYLVERIAGDRVDVIVLVGSGFNPSTYEPKPKQLTRLSRAQLFFLTGVPFERKWISVFKDVNKEMKLVPLPAGIKRRLFPDSTAHQHNAKHDQKDNNHDKWDPHFWLNPVYAKMAAASIKDSLLTEDPGNAEFYRDNYEVLAQELTALNERIAAKLAQTRQKQFLVFHPSWGYFADAYGLSQVAIEVQGRQAGAKTLNNIINNVKQMDAKVIFVQKQFNDKDAKMIAQQTGVKLVQIDPLAEDYIKNMELASAKFYEALQ